MYLSSEPETSSKASPNFPAKKILLAVDGSENSTRAAKVGLVLAKQNGASVAILNVVPPLIVVPSRVGVDLGPYAENARIKAEDIVKRILESAKREGLYEVETLVESSSNSIVETIVQVASSKKIDLIVIGTRGLGGFKRLLLGSVSSGVVTHAFCNVLVVR